MTVQILSSNQIDLDTRVIDWIKSSLDAIPAARTLKRVAFVMPIDGEEELVLVNQKTDEIRIGSDLPVDGNAGDTLEVDGTFWNLIAAPDGASEAYSTLCDTQNLEESAAVLDAALEIPETPSPVAEVDEQTNEILTELAAYTTPETPATIENTTMEEIDNGIDSILADIDALDNKTDKETVTMPDPTTATRRTLTVDDDDSTTTVNNIADLAQQDPRPVDVIEPLDPNADAKLATEIVNEIAAEDAADAVEDTATVDPTAKVKKPRTPKLPVRERIINKILNKLGLTQLPTPESMFAKFTNAKHVKWVTAAELAVFNSTLSFDGDMTEVGKTLNDLADKFGSENILNESAEILPTRIIEVATALLRHGRIVHLVKAAKINPDTIPATVLASHEGLDLKVLQVWDGRHRTGGLVMLFGSDIKIPVLVEDKTFEEAYDDALISNDTRAYGKTEAMTYFGLTSEIQTGHDIAGSFALCKGSAPAVMKWVGYHTTSKRDSDTLEPLTVPVSDRIAKGKVGMTTPSYGNIVKGAMSVYGKDTLSNLENAKPYIDCTIMVINAAWDYIKEHAPERQNNIWTSYGTQVLGKVIGEAFTKAVSAQTEFDPSAFAASMMKAVLGYISVNAEGWNNLKPSELYVALHDYAAGKGTPLPRPVTPGAAKSILKTT